MPRHFVVNALFFVALTFIGGCHFSVTSSSSGQGEPPMQPGAEKVTSGFSAEYKPISGGFAIHVKNDTGRTFGATNQLGVAWKDTSGAHWQYLSGGLTWKPGDRMMLTFAPNIKPQNVRVVGPTNEAGDKTGPIYIDCSLPSP